MKARLNPKLETFLLLAGPPWNEGQKKEVLEGLASLGVNAEQFYKRHYPLLETYYTTFYKNMVHSAATKQLETFDESLLDKYLTLFGRHPDWFEDIEAVPEEEVRREVDSVLGATAKDHVDIVNAVEALPIGPEAKWQTMLLLQKPKEQLCLTAAAVMDNLPAFEKAQAKIAKGLSALLRSFGHSLEGPSPHLLHTTYSIRPDSPILPTLAHPVLVMIMEDFTLYGLLVDKLVSGGEEFTKEDLLVGAKALSESSKVEILLALKEQSLYNLEIAERVHLTPGTVSHHMAALIAAGFVRLEKRDGKVYYHLATQSIQRFLTGTGSLLL